jgi:hypothetical protein
MRAAALVTSPGVRLLHVGGALDPALGDAARRTQATRRATAGWAPCPTCRPGAF